MSSKEFQDAVERARLLEIAERYEDMAEEMRKAVEIIAKERQELSVSARNSFSLAYKNLVSSRRSSWRALFSEKIKIQETKPKELHNVDDLLIRVEKELHAYCDQVLNIIDNYILAGENYSCAHRVFFLKMKGDYYRYKAEILKGEEEAGVSNLAMDSYMKAKKIADDELKLTDPIRLGLYLNFSVYQYEIKGNIEEACKIARNAFDTAIVELDTLSEDYYKDSTLIMQLLRDNLTLWSSEENANANNNLKEEPAEAS